MNKQCTILSIFMVANKKPIINPSIQQKMCMNGQHVQKTNELISKLIHQFYERVACLVRMPYQSEVVEDDGEALESMT